MRCPWHHLALTAVISTAIAGCVNKTPLTEAQQVYAGRWVARDDTYVQIYLDGGGDFEGSNTSITGGATTITDNTLKISLGPISQSYRITAPPQQQNGIWVMELNGIAYRRQDR